MLLELVLLHYSLNRRPTLANGFITEVCEGKLREVVVKAKTKHPFDYIALVLAFNQSVLLLALTLCLEPNF